GQTLGPDADAWRRLFEPLVRYSGTLFADTLAPLRLPRHPLLLARLGLRTVWSARHIANRWFQGDKAKGLFAGCAAHSVLPLEQQLSAAVGIMLAIAGHAIGWPVARGGSQRITDALASCLRSLGGTIEAGRRVQSLADIPQAKAIFFDTSP